MGEDLARSRASDRTGEWTGEWGGPPPKFTALTIGEVDRGYEAAVARLGGRLLARIDWASLPLELGRHAGRPMLLVEAEGVAEAILLGALPRIDAVAMALGLPVVVALDTVQIDLVAAQLLTRDQALLVEADAFDRLAAVATAAGRLGDPVLRDHVREGEESPLARLNEEVARIADLLARLTREGSAYGSGHDRVDRRPAARDSIIAVSDRRSRFAIAPDDAEARHADRADNAALVRQTIRARRLRDGFLGKGLFEDPAWDMVLDLYAAHLEGERVSVSSLCIASAVAPTTALRWIGKLTDVGLMIRQPDPSDRRRAFVALSEKARQGMHAYVAAVRRAGLPIA